MSDEVELEIYLKVAAKDILTFIEGCSKHLDGLPERAMISSVSQYMTLVRKGLNSRTDEESCVSRLDIVECQIEAMRSILLATEQTKAMMLREEKLQ